MYVNVRISKSLKEELAWAIDKWLQLISNKMLFKIVIPLRNQRIKLKATLYPLLCGP